MDPERLKSIPDKLLVNLLSEDNELALGEIFNRYWDKLFIMADKVLLDEEMAKDIVQEVFVRIWERRYTIKVKNLNAYLNQAVKYQIASYFRKGKFTERHKETFESIADAIGTEQIIEIKELNDAIVLSLDQVPDRCREIFLLSRYENLSNQEIADKLNLSIRTVETQISNALRHLRTNLKL